MLYVCTKFHENISKGFIVIEQTRFSDGQTDAQGKNNISSSLNGGDNVLDSFITIITTKMLNKMLVYLPKADT